MPKPVPSDTMSQQSVEGSHDELKAQEVQEDQQAQNIAAQSGNGAGSTSQPVEAQMNGRSIQAVQTKLQEALRPSRYCSTQHGPCYSSWCSRLVYSLLNSLSMCGLQ